MTDFVLGEEVRLARPQPDQSQLHGSPEGRWFEVKRGMGSWAQLEDGRWAIVARLSFECDECGAQHTDRDPMRFEGPTTKGIDFTFCSTACRERFRED